MGDSNLPVPIMVDPHAVNRRMWIPIKNLNVEKPMYWCKPRRYRARMTPPDSDPESESDAESIEALPQIEGFFIAGSDDDINRIYVFRPSRPNAEEVEPVAELNDYTAEGGVLTSSSSSSGWSSD